MPAKAPLLSSLWGLGLSRARRPPFGGLNEDSEYDPAVETFRMDAPAECSGVMVIASPNPTPAEADCAPPPARFGACFCVSSLPPMSASLSHRVVEIVKRDPSSSTPPLPPPTLPPPIPPPQTERGLRTTPPARLLCGEGVRARASCLPNGLRSSIFFMM